MTFRTLYFSESTKYSWEERYSSFRGKAIENEIKVNKNTSKRYSREFW